MTNNDRLPKDRRLVQDALREVAFGPESFMKWVRKNHDEFDVPFFNLLRKMREYTEKSDDPALGKTFRFLETCFQKMFDLDGEYGSIVVTEDNYNEYIKKASRHLETNRAHHAIPLLEAVNMFFGQNNKEQGLESIYSNLGIAYAQGNKPKRALDNLHKALSIAQKSNSRNVGMIFSNLAMTYSATGDYKECISYHEKALEIARKENQKEMQIKHLSNLAIANMDNGNLEKAINNQTEALRIAEETNNTRAVSDGLTRMGILCACAGNVKEANNLCTKALDLHSNDPFSGGE